VEETLIIHIFEPIIQSLLKNIDGWSLHNWRWQPIPCINNSLAEETLLQVQPTSLNLYFQSMTTQTISTIIQLEASIFMMPTLSSSLFIYVNTTVINRSSTYIGVHFSYLNLTALQPNTMCIRKWLHCTNVHMKACPIEEEEITILPVDGEYVRHTFVLLQANWSCSIVNITQIQVFNHVTHHSLSRLEIKHKTMNKWVQISKLTINKLCHSTTL